jgi:hypothetical protein
LGSAAQRSDGSALATVPRRSEKNKSRVTRPF